MGTRIPRKPGKKRCWCCGEMVPLENFGPLRRAADGLNYTCRPCKAKEQVAHRERNRMRGRSGDELKRHGFDHVSFNMLYDSQSGRCAICQVEFTQVNPPHVDHDHRCPHKRGSCGKCHRALLCRACNGGIGLFMDNPEIVRAAEVYLTKWGERDVQRIPKLSERHQGQL